MGEKYQESRLKNLDMEELIGHSKDLDSRPKCNQITNRLQIGKSTN